MIQFRELEPNEIEIRTEKKNGMYQLMFYKDARCDQRILDETVGPLGWQKRYSRNNMNCVVSIWDDKKSQWVEKEDTGTESSENKEKGLASDSFKRACFVWGIGRSLYTIKELNTYVTPDELGKAAKDLFIDGEFKVLNIEYDKGSVKGLVVGFYYKGKRQFQKKFTRNGSQTKIEADDIHDSKPQSVSKNSEFKYLEDAIGNEKFLFGNCKGQTIQEAENKNIELLRAFIDWVKTANPDYSKEPAKKAQFEKLKALIRR